MKKTIITLFIVLIMVGILFRIFCGIFVIQPIGSIPEGATIIYWRSGLNLPFISPLGVASRYVVFNKASHLHTWICIYTTIHSKV